MLRHTESMKRQRDIPDLVSDDGVAERVVVVGMQRDGTADETELSLDELSSLVSSAGGEVVARVVQRRA
jgi:hypothetical protein